MISVSMTSHALFHSPQVIPDPILIDHMKPPLLLISIGQNKPQDLRR